jgi:hypothetical protein
MFVTPQQAAELTCHRTLVPMMVDGLVNSGASMCVGPQCMAWRWLRTMGERDNMKPATRGYCGLAGAPQP